MSLKNRLNGNTLAISSLSRGDIIAVSFILSTCYCKTTLGTPCMIYKTQDLTSSTKKLIVFIYNTHKILKRVEFISYA